jgi:hypothetical protein
MSIVDVRAEIRDFLGTRRARLAPEQAGLPAYGNRIAKDATGTPTADALKLLASWAASEEDLPTETIASAKK